MEKKRIKVAIITPPLKAHAKRGVGVFTSELISCLKKSDEILIEEVAFGTDLENFDVIHYPYFDPFFLTLPRKISQNTIITIHDLIPIHLKDHYKIGLRGNLKWEIQRRIAKDAKIICTDSYFSKEDIVKYIGVLPEKVQVVYGGVNDDFFKEIPSEKKEEIIKILKIPKKFLLYVGDINYNKNVLGLLAVLKKLIPKNPNLHLAMVGSAFKRDSIELRQIKKKIDELHIESFVTMLDFISLNALKALYQSAQLYIQPSILEGFGLPVLEAMASGCVVASSTGGSLKELVTGCSFEFNPLNQDFMVQTIADGLENVPKRAEYKKKGILNAKKYTWNKAASSMVTLYKSIKLHEK